MAITSVCELLAKRKQMGFPIRTVALRGLEKAQAYQVQPDLRDVVQLEKYEGWQSPFLR